MTERDAKIDRLRHLEPFLRSRIRGQDHVIAPVAGALIDAEMGLSAPGRPKASFLFVGPTGTGKTEIVLTFTRYLYGADGLLRFDLSEYQGDTAIAKFLGADRSDPGLLGRALESGSSGVLFFDEIEKAHPDILDQFLQMLDASRVTVATGKTYTLDPYIIALTSNIGSAEAMRMDRSNWASIEAATFRRVRQVLRPELVNRFTEKCVFRRLDPAAQNDICWLLAEEEVARLNALGHSISIGAGAIEFLVRHGFDAEQGARPLRRMVESHLQRSVRNSLFQCGAADGMVVATGSTLELIPCGRMPSQIRRAGA